MRKMLLLAAVVAAPLPTVAHEYKLGAIAIDHPWARPAVAGRNGAAYLGLANGGEADRLIAASSPMARKVELHTHLIDSAGVARMRPVDGVDLPAGGEATLAPGGLHVMLFGLGEALQEGRRFPLTLTFERAGEIEVEVAVEKGASAAHEHGH